MEQNILPEIVEKEIIRYLEKSEAASYANIVRDIGRKFEQGALSNSMRKMIQDERIISKLSNEASKWSPRLYSLNK